MPRRSAGDRADMSDGADGADGGDGGEVKNLCGCPTMQPHNNVCFLV